MRVLLDACVPLQLRRELRGHEVSAAPELGWGDLDDAALLGAMGDLFDALVAVDKNLPKQQTISGRAFGVVVLRAHSNRFGDLLPLVPGLLSALGSVKPGEVLEVAR